MLPFFSLEEKDKALKELAKLVDQDISGYTREKELIRNLVAHGFSEERAVELADWAIQWYEKSTRLAPEDEALWYSEVAKERLHEGTNKQQVADELVQLGLDREDATKLVDQVGTPRESAEQPEPEELSKEQTALAGKYSRQMWHGICWVPGGIVLAAFASGVRYSEPRIVIYLAALVAVLFGLANSISGHLGLARCKTEDITEDVDDEEKEFMCPVCGLDIQTWQRECPRCGTEIDWRER